MAHVAGVAHLDGRIQLSWFKTSQAHSLAQTEAFALLFVAQIASSRYWADIPFFSDACGVVTFVNEKQNLHWDCMTVLLTFFL